MKHLKRFLSARTTSNSISMAPIDRFQSDHYTRHNARRLEHLSSLGISVAGSRVLEVGAGIGDHTHYYLDRGCEVTATDARPESLDILKSRYPGCRVERLDVEAHGVWLGGAQFDVVHCYGLLYHVCNPQVVLRAASDAASRLLFLESCVSFGNEEAVNPVSEPTEDPTQAFGGVGCRPTRRWILSHLKERFEFVYVPRTQPNHYEFPLDWTRPELHTAKYQRAVFVASRSRIESELLSEDLVEIQVRHA
jgi:SAM-dependent methyltransferase